MSVVQQFSGLSLAHREAALQVYSKRVLGDALLARFQAIASNLALNPKPLSAATLALVHALAQAMAHELQAIASSSPALAIAIPSPNAVEIPSMEAVPDLDARSSMADSSPKQAMQAVQSPRIVGVAKNGASPAYQSPAPETSENEATLLTAATATAEAAAAARRTNERAADLRLLLVRGVRRGCADSLLLSREVTTVLKAASGTGAFSSAENVPGNSHGVEPSVCLEERVSPELLAATQRVVRTVAHAEEARRVEVIAVCQTISKHHNSLIAATGSSSQESLQRHSTSSQPQFNSGSAVAHEVLSKSSENGFKPSESALTPDCTSPAFPAASANVGDGTGALAGEAVHEGWLAATSDVSELGEYAVAAAKMGERGWVKQGMQWCADRALSFYSPVQSSSASSLPVVRLLDVGSCYNPFSRDPSLGGSALQVTALDLCPQPGTGVLRGDFLTVPIQPVIIDGAALTNGAASTSAEAEISSEIHSSNLKTSHGKQTDANGVLIGTYVEGRDETDSSGSGSGSGSGDSSNGSNGRNEMPSVAVLPEGGFDVVAMSLVLSYLPDPFLRTRMLTQARKCLQPSPINTTSRDATAPITEAAKTQAGTAAGTELLPSREDDDTNKHPSVSDVGSNVVPPPKGGLLLIVDRWSIARDPPSELALQRKAAYEQRRALRRQELASRGHTVTEPTSAKTRQGGGGEGEGGAENEVGRGGKVVPSSALPSADAAVGSSTKSSFKMKKQASILDQWCEAAAACGFKLEAYDALSCSEAEVVDNLGLGKRSNHHNKDGSNGNTTTTVASESLKVKAKARLRAHALAFRAVPLSPATSEGSASSTSTGKPSGDGQNGNDNSNVGVGSDGSDGNNEASANPWASVEDAALKFPMRTRQEFKAMGLTLR